MFFAAFDQVERNQQSKFSTFYGRLTFTFKLLLWISFGFLIYNLITLNGLLFANRPTLTFTHLQIWRIFTAPFATLDGLYGLVSLIIAFWWLASLFPGYERKYSSLHLLIQVFVQNVVLQIVYGLVVILLVRNTYFYETYNDYFFSIGWVPIIIIWMFKYTGQCKQQKINFCFLPFLLKAKYLAWIISICMILLTVQKLPLIMATILGATQFHFFHRSINKLPLFCYPFLDKFFCICARLCSNYITVDSVKHRLALLCGYRSNQLLVQEQQSENQIQPGQEKKNYENYQFQEAINKKQSQVQLTQQTNNKSQKNQSVQKQQD